MVTACECQRQLLHHHAPYRLRPKRKRRLPSPIRPDLEPLVLAHHLQEPLVCFMACGEAVGGRESERHLGGRLVWVLATDCQAWSAYWRAEAAVEVPRLHAHVLKLGAMLGRCDCRTELMELCLETHIMQSSRLTVGPENPRNSATFLNVRLRTILASWRHDYTARRLSCCCSRTPVGRRLPKVARWIRRLVCRNVCWPSQRC